MKAAGILLALALLMTCMVSGTMAKYTSSATGSDTATVAKWSIEVNDTEIATASPATLTFGLFDTINEADTTTAEDSVSAGKIAPGTGGAFALKVENLSEVDAKYTISLSETNANNVPIQYSLDKTTWKDDLTEINADASMTDKNIAKENGSETVTVYWRWAFESAEGTHDGQTDTTDTALGIAAQTSAPTVEIAATITATQVD